MKSYLLCTICSLILSIVFCAVLIPLLCKMKAGQNILVYVKEHQNKSGTPTMGGLAFISAAVLSSLPFLTEMGRTALITLAVGVAYMLVGFIDDFLKQKHKENLGLRAWQKCLFQLAIALVVSVYAYRARLTNLYLPFFDRWIDLGIWCIPFYVLFFIATVNAVNLTDGLDGLAGATCTPFFIILGFMLILRYGDPSQTALCFCLAGALLGYLLFNAPPAKVFMGDTGSLALGGFMACICAFTGNAFYVVVMGLPFVITVLSVVIQVIYYKVSGGKRVFLMAPVHHHFQKRGHSETRISYAYFLITLLIGLICMVGIL